MSDVEQLLRIKSQTLGLIADITAQPKPTYMIDHQRVSWTEYLAELQQTVAWCEQQLAAAQPVEIRSRGVS
ncbi:MAG: hypothetical protein ABR915_09125 [Thermoguttaceae bacterium]|jgi:hypothetical protein